MARGTREGHQRKRTRAAHQLTQKVARFTLPAELIRGSPRVQGWSHLHGLLIGFHSLPEKLEPVISRLCSVPMLRHRLRSSFCWTKYSCSGPLFGLALAR